MALFDLEPLLAPISDDSAAGPDLEYDPAFLELERTAAPKAERAIGDAVKAAEEPDWNKVVELSEAVLARSKDLRAALHLATAWMRTSGMPGWSAGLGLIHGLLERFDWQAEESGEWTRRRADLRESLERRRCP